MSKKGEDVVTACNGVPIARLIPFLEKPIRREPGVLRTHPALENFAYDPEVFAPVIDEELEAEGWI